MELLWLRYFKKLAENEHLTHTAEQLYISPPSLSATLSRLEEELGVQLFDRPGKGIFLNNNGRTFLHYVNIALSALDEAKHELASINESSFNHLLIGVTSPVRYQRGLFAFMKAYPDIILTQNVIDLLSLNRSESILNYDFILSASIDFNIGDCDSAILYSDDLPMLAVSSSHPFSSLREISIYKACNEVFIVTPKNSSSRIYFEDFFNIAQRTPKCILECDYSMRKQMIINKYGIGLSTLTTSLDDKSPEIKYIRVSEPIYHRTHKISWHLNRNHTKQATLFYNFILSYYEKGINGLFQDTDH